MPSDVSAFVSALPPPRAQATAAARSARAAASIRESRWTPAPRLSRRAFCPSPHGDAPGVAAAAPRPTARTATAMSAENGSSAGDASGNGALPAEVPNPARLSAGARARTVVHICSSATLCTASQRHSGVPFGSHVDFIQDAVGNPILLLANNANHTRNLTGEPRCSLFCQPASTAGQDGCRATLVGAVSPLEGDDAAELRDAYTEAHSHVRDALQYPGLFAFYRMRVEDVLFVGGYGVISQWVPASDFLSAAPDPLAFVAPEIVTRLNESKEADLRRLSRIFLGLDDVAKCSMTSLDQLGFDLRVRDGAGLTQEYRVAFRESVHNRFDVQSALVKAFQEAWERENGFDETWEGGDVRATVEYAPS